ncbi:MAG TPA: MFS transporter, partial [Planctomycetaceae bacterium]|nr:MFS transporter [Planctomycetaceae bacterium]
MAAPKIAESPQSSQQVVFWGCFIALVTTSFAFVSRITLCSVRFGTEFNLDSVKVGELIGAGIWPFAISIILFSLVIDRIGYKVAMLFSFVSFAAYLTMACMAYSKVHGPGGELLVDVDAQKAGYDLMYLASIILALGNGTVEAFINPVVATMFNKEKTKWLNILHAGWPGGLVFCGLATIALEDTLKNGDWRIVVGLVAIPAVIYLLMLIGARFPKSEQEAAGVPYRQMLGEFGAFGALVGFGLISMQLAEVFGWNEGGLRYIAPVLTGLVTVGFGVYTGSFGRPILAFLIIIMMPLATTEIGTDSWISGLMEEPMKDAGRNAVWVLVYTSAIMMVLRFFAGPIVHSLSPIGLLITSSILAIAGLFALSKCGNAGIGMIFAAATLYGFGKTFFWPTMLGVTAEQCPKGGALTLNAISGIGMIAVGVLGTPFIGYVQAQTASTVLTEKSAEVAKSVISDKKFMGIEYKTIDPNKEKAIQVEVMANITDDLMEKSIKEVKESESFEAGSSLEQLA